MFYMKVLPAEEDFHTLAPAYEELDAPAVLLFYSFLKAGSDLLTAFDGYLSHHGISQGRFIVLLLLLRSKIRSENGGLSPSTLAEQAGVTRATMTGLLDGLERDDLVERVPDDGDRRRLTVHLTEKGRKVLHGMFPDYYSRIAHVMSDLDGKERKIFDKILDKMNSRIADFPAQDMGAAHQDHSGNGEPPALRSGRK